MEISRHFVKISALNQKINVHYRTAGESHLPKLIVLHPSPLSSEFMQGIIEQFAAEYHVVAWDLPGYGDSDKLTQSSLSLVDYSNCLATFMEVLGISSAIIYGNATGAQLAIEFAKLFPQKSSKLLLENVAWFYPQERETLLANYFPDLSPKTDGSHLALMWKMANQLYQYFPWYDTSAQAKLSAPMPSQEVIMQTFKGYLKAGERYSDAYIAAINNEDPKQLAAVPIPVDILVWQHSIIYHYCQRLYDVELPENIQIHTESGDLMARYKQLVLLAKNQNKRETTCH
ncbi:alpha/beta hydrolase [Thalassotalea sp. M1531]|uniref:Alpha/beta hydrolase n=1 Tax=Thalassotalea algicola TaxID=2716224 RepID=A0A7Y0Q5U7_9GAMM|nr:alpha/beta hydrolase [Thalassotalea algicola]NMP30107.1 alpha/beta hydrolase [Thalassotalea algicola]